MTQQRLRPADTAWIVILSGSIAFELMSHDLLSDSAQRLCVKHPLWGRFAILAVAGHLAGVLPSHIDLFNARNVVHRGIVLGYTKIGLSSPRTWLKRGQNAQL